MTLKLQGSKVPRHMYYKFCPFCFMINYFQAVLETVWMKKNHNCRRKKIIFSENMQVHIFTKWTQNEIKAWRVKSMTCTPELMQVAQIHPFHSTISRFQHICSFAFSHWPHNFFLISFSFPFNHNTSNFFPISVNFFFHFLPKNSFYVDCCWEQVKNLVGKE